MLIVTAVLVVGCGGDPGTRPAKNGDTVQVDYTGALIDGTVFDSSIGLEPPEFVLGSGEFFPAFEKAVVGMKVGQTKTFVIKSNDAYGPYYEEKVLVVPRTLIPQDITPEVGMVLYQQADGETITAVITEVTEDTVTVDANHWLAGQDLVFEIQLLKIK